MFLRPARDIILVMSRSRSIFAGTLIALIIVETTVVPVFAATSVTPNASSNQSSGSGVVGDASTIASLTSTIGGLVSDIGGGISAIPGVLSELGFGASGQLPTPAAPDTTCNSDVNPAGVGLVIGSLLTGFAISSADLIVTDSAIDEAKEVPIVGDVVEAVENALNYFSDRWYLAITLAVVSGIAVWLAGGIMQFAEHLNSTITSSVTGTSGDPMISIISGIAISLMNLAIILALIVVAYGTMFRREKWGISNLPRIIVTALLINFSMFVALWIAGIGTRITASMTAQICNGNFVDEFNTYTIWYQIIHAFSQSGLLAEILAWIGGLFVASLVCFIAAVTLSAIAGFMIVRFVMMIILIGLAPVAWLSFMLPELKIAEFGGNTWNGWWSRFLKWVFFGPIMLFFLWLTNALMTYLSSTYGASTDPFVVMGNISAVIVMLCLGLYAAYKTGGAITTITMGAASLGMGGLLTTANALQTKAYDLAGSITGGQEKNLSFGKRLALNNLKSVGRGGEAQQDLGKVFGHFGMEIPKSKVSDKGLTEAGLKWEKNKDLEKKRSDIIAKEFPAYDDDDKISAALELQSRGDLDKLENKHELMTEEWKGKFEDAGANFRTLQAATATTPEAQAALKAGNYAEYNRLQNEYMKAMGPSQKNEFAKNFKAIMGKDKNFMGYTADQNKIYIDNLTQNIKDGPGADVSKYLSNLDSTEFYRARDKLYAAGMPNFGKVPGVQNPNPGLLNADGTRNTNSIKIEKDALIDALKSEHQRVYNAQNEQYKDFLNKQRSLLEEEVLKAKTVTNPLEIPLAEKRLSNLQADQIKQLGDKQKELADLQKKQSDEISSMSNMGEDEVIAKAQAKYDPRFSKIMERTLAQREGLAPPPPSGEAPTT